MKAYLEKVRNSTPYNGYKWLLTELLSLQSGERLIDIGCGLGDDVRAAATVVWPNGYAVGVEQDTKTLEVLANPLAWPPGAHFVGGNATALPFADASFDVARIDRVLHMLVDPGAALSETRRVLVPHGRLLVAEPLWATLKLSGQRLDHSRVARQVEQETASAPGVASFDPISLVQKAGCGVAEVLRQNVQFEDLGEARVLLHLDRSVFALRLRKKIDASDVQSWQAAVEADAADGSFRAALGGVVLCLSCDPGAASGAFPGHSWQDQT